MKIMIVIDHNDHNDYDNDNNYDNDNGDQMTFQPMHFGESFFFLL